MKCYADSNHGRLLAARPDAHRAGCTINSRVQASIWLSSDESEHNAMVMGAKETLGAATLLQD